MMHYPPQVRKVLGSVVTGKRAVADKLMMDLSAMVPNKTAFSSAAKILREKSRSTLVHIEHQFAATLTSPTHQAKIATMLGERERLSDFPAIDAIFPRGFLSHQYLERIYLDRHVELLPYFERSLQQIGATLLRADKSYKVVRYIFSCHGRNDVGLGQGSTRSYDSLYTVMNEHNQVVAIKFCRSGDNDEMERLLAQVKRRFDLLGYEEIELFYTDNCCHEYPMLAKVFPSLVDGRPCRLLEEHGADFQGLELPEDWAVRTISSYADLTTFCLAVTERLDALEDGELLDLSLDVEWDSPRKHPNADGKPKVLQLSHSADGFDPLIGVIQLDKVFARTRSITRDFHRRRGILRQLFSHPSLRLVGVNVKGDITWLMKLEGSDGLIGNAADIKVKCLDLASYEQRLRHVAGGARKGYYSLDSILRRHLGKKLLKEERVRQSKWSRSTLHADQIIYAAKDAWAGSLVIQKLNELACTHRKPTSLVSFTVLPIITLHAFTIVFELC